MAPSTPVLALALALAAIFGSLAGVSAVNTHRVQVGSGGLVFNPSNIFGAQGDVVEFIFYPRNHSVVQGDPAKACSPIANGFFSGYFPTTTGEATDSFSIVLSDANPIYIYCSSGSHCQDGMVAVINPASNAAQASYSSAAATVTSVQPPPSNPTGGIIGAAGNNGAGGTGVVTTITPTGNSTIVGASITSTAATSAGTATGTAGAGSATGSATGSSTPTSGSSSSSSGGAAAAVGAGGLQNGWVLPIVLGLLGLVGL